MAVKFRVKRIIHEERRVIVNFYSDLINETEVEIVNGRPLTVVVDVPESVTTLTDLKALVLSRAPTDDLARVEYLKANPPGDLLGPFKQYIGVEISDNG